MNSKFCGIDIGKKNLSFCIVTKSSENKLIAIDEWVKVNLIEESLYSCSGCYKNGKQCIAKPKFYHVKDDITKYYCKLHKTQHIVDGNVEIVKYNNENKDKCSHKSTKNINCMKNATCSIDGIIFCKTHSEQMEKNTNKKNYLLPFKKTNSCDVDPQTLCTRMFNNFNKYEIFKEVKEIRIENQPSFLAPEMKAVASMVFSYFIWLNVTYGLNIKVYYVSAVNKMNYTESFIKFVDDKISEHKKIKKEVCKCDVCKMEIELVNNKKEHNLDYGKYYFDHENVKQVSIYWAEYTLIENGMGHLFKMLDDRKKKDDDCDSFIYAMKNSKIIKK
jgi:hypothetical protein